MKNKRGQHRQPGAHALPGAGRPTIKAMIRQGDELMISQTYAGGTADLGRGRAEVETIGGNRIVKLVQADGSEIRILIIEM